MLRFYTAAGGNPNYVIYEDLKNAMEVGVDRKPPEKVMSDVIAHFRVNVNHKFISLDI